MSVVATQHPQYVDRLPEWRQMRDTLRGQTAVKARGTDYLPMPSSFGAQPDGGVEMYGAYLARAQFEDLVNPTVEGITGLIHGREAQVELPSAMEGLWENADGKGQPLEALHEALTRELCSTGRVGLLVDAPSEGAELPRILLYTAEAIINWSEEGDFFVLDETGLVRNEFQWTERKRWRVLELRDRVYTVQKYTEAGAEDVVTPNRRGSRKALDAIPFVVMGARAVEIEPDNPPLLGVSNAALAAYRLDADYRHQLFWTGQETLVTVGLVQDDVPKVVGSGVVIGIPEGGSADYLSPSGVGIEAHRQAIADERAKANAAGASLIEEDPTVQESGAARSLRYKSRTATLTTISTAGAKGLERALRHCATMMGLDPSGIVVTPNTTFFDTTMTPQDGQALVGMWQGNAISYQTLYENLQRGNIASSERTHEEELALIEEQNPLGDPDVLPGDEAPLDPDPEDPYANLYDETSDSEFET